MTVSACVFHVQPKPASRVKAYRTRKKSLAGDISYLVTFYKPFKNASNAQWLSSMPP
jgi:hypothetical protein